MVEVTVNRQTVYFGNSVELPNYDCLVAVENVTATKCDLIYIEEV